jgi:hypothetical protein
MRLEPLYRVRFAYPESWAVGLEGGWQQMFLLADGRCPAQAGPDLVMDVAEVIWEPIAD